AEHLPRKLDPGARSPLRRRATGGWIGVAVPYRIANSCRFATGRPMAPLAFLSYTRKDAEFFGGYITEFRKTLENAVHVVSGSEAFKIFQDVEGIVIGESWKKKLSDVISASSFFVPMVSPLFLSSEPCRDEVNEFLEHERSLGRDDLILPVYFLVTA